MSQTESLDFNALRKGEKKIINLKFIFSKGTCLRHATLRYDKKMKNLPKDKSFVEIFKEKIIFHSNVTECEKDIRRMDGNERKRDKHDMKIN